MMCNTSYFNAITEEANTEEALCELGRCCQEHRKGTWLVTFHLHTGWREEEPERKGGHKQTRKHFLVMYFPQEGSTLKIPPPSQPVLPPDIKCSYK